MESNFFIYDGVKSSDMGIHLVRIGGGMVEAPYFGGVTLNNERLNNKILTYNYGVNYTPLEFSLIISPLEREWTPELRNFIGKWLFKNHFAPFQTGDDLNKIYYARAVEAPHLSLYNGKGYLEIKMVTNSPYAWSPIKYNYYELKGGGSKEIILNNDSNIGKNFLPILEIKNSSNETFELIGGNKVYKNPIALKNKSNKGNIMKIYGFEGKEEIISLDCENEIIKSNLYGSEPFKRFNRDWLELVPGENLIEVTGECEMWTKMQFPILQ